MFVQLLRRIGLVGAVSGLALTGGLAFTGAPEASASTTTSANEAETRAETSGADYGGKYYHRWKCYSVGIAAVQYDWANAFLCKHQQPRVHREYWDLWLF